MAIQGQNGQQGNTQPVNLGQNLTAPRPNWKENLTCCTCREKGHLAKECPHTGNSTITKSQWTPIVSTQQTSCAGPTQFPGTNPTLSLILTAENPIAVEVWHTLMEQLNKVN